MDIPKLRIFATVARLGNFTRAAELLYLTQPTVSQQIAALEAQLGAPLIERLPRRLRLTPAGEASEDGQAEVVIAGGTFVLTPSAGDVLRVPFDQIASVGEGEQPFTLRVALAQGTVVELSRLGAMRTQVLAELKDAHADSAANDFARTRTMPGPSLVNRALTFNEPPKTGCSVTSPSSSRSPVTLASTGRSKRADRRPAMSRPS